MEDIVRTYGPLAVSLLALFISFRGYRISRRAEKRNVAATKPIVSATISSVEGELNWFHMQFKIENRASHGYRGDVVLLSYPEKAVGVTESQAYDGPAYDLKRKSPLPLSEAGRSMPISFNIPGVGHIHGSASYCAIYVYVPSGWFADTLSMRVRLISVEGLERTEDFWVSRKLPDRKWYRERNARDQH